MIKYCFSALIWILLLFQHLYAVDCNGRLLEMYTDNLEEKLWRHASVTEKDIQPKLNFVSFSHSSPPPSFLLASSLEKIQPFRDDQFFSSFSSACQRMYESSQDEEEKIALCMLLDSVVNRHIKSCKMQRKIRDFAQRDVQTEVTQPPRFIGTADRSPPLMTAQFLSSGIF